MSEALFGFLGVIVGAVVSLLGEQFTTKREREARRALREQDRKDRRDAFQREAILALQDALVEYGRLVSVAQDTALAYAKQTGHRMPQSRGDAPLPDGYSAAHMRVTMLRARIFDDDLRKVVGDVQHSYSHAVFTTDPKVVRDYSLSATAAWTDMEERMNVLLKKLC